MPWQGSQRQLKKKPPLATSMAMSQSKDALGAISSQHSRSHVVTLVLLTTATQVRVAGLQSG